MLHIPLSHAQKQAAANHPGNLATVSSDADARAAKAFSRRNVHANRVLSEEYE
jgi:Cu/Zn superoxide dismutase